MVSSSRCGKGARPLWTMARKMTGQKLQDQLLMSISPAAFSPKNKSVTVVFCYISEYIMLFSVKSSPPKNDSIIQSHSLLSDPPKKRRLQVLPSRSYFI